MVTFVSDLLWYNKMQFWAFAYYGGWGVNVLSIIKYAKR